jgi:hypothetical protein
MRSLIAMTAAVVFALNAALCMAQEVHSGPFDLRSMPGFRLIEPSYRASGDGMNVSVLLCRLTGWAASSPSSVHFRRAGTSGDELGHNDVRIARIGLRSGENCDRVVTHFSGAPKSVESITICLAYSHRRCE